MTRTIVIEKYFFGICYHRYTYTETVVDDEPKEKNAPKPKKKKKKSLQKMGDDYGQRTVDFFNKQYDDLITTPRVTNASKRLEDGVNNDD